jgi:hypothetical protein
MSSDPTSTPDRWSALQSLAAESPLRVRVNGECMTPLVSDGAWVAVGGPASRYWPGDVVVARLPGGRFAMHRVIGGYRRRGHWHYLTQGDRAPWPDTPVTGPLILGRVSGGDCSPLILSVPLQHRLRALGRFARFILIKIIQGRHQ